MEIKLYRIICMVDSKRLPQISSDSSYSHLNYTFSVRIRQVSTGAYLSVEDIIVFVALVLP